MERLLPLSRVARYLSVTEADVEAWSENGQLVPSVELPNGERRWRRPDLDAWVDQLPTVRDAVDRSPDLVAGGIGGTENSLPFSELATQILEVLRGSPSGWVLGQTIAAGISEEVDNTSGAWSRAVKELRLAGLIESHNKRGYRLLSSGEEEEGDD